ncbi:MAG: NADH-quinone oxidoreductase subunit M [Nitrospinota bacterium]|nr:MAG: NADH-quinone oxidoreductase subunit M [Nitrospinota bacterium]
MIEHALGGFPILSLITYLPLVGALIIMAFLQKEQTREIKYFALSVSLVDAIISIVFLVPYFDTTTHQFQFVERASWIPAIGVEYFFGVDGISILLVLLTTILTAISVLSSFTAITEREKEYYVSLLLLETGMLGVFVALDLFLFYVFWEVMLVPMYFLIGIWGGPRKLYAAIKFFLYTLFGSVLMLLGILGLYFIHGGQTGVYTFNFLELLQTNLSTTQQIWLFLAFFIAFAIKVPMFPFHTWLPDAHVEAPTAGSVILAGVLLKMGTYGFVRFSLSLFPYASQYFVPAMVVLAVIGIIYGALVAMAQQDVKKLVAYSSVSHLGFVMLGMFALNPEGIMGSILQMINHGLSTGALFLIVGIIYERRHTRLISDFGGISRKVPVFATIFAITMFSSIGLPGLNGFVGEFLILVGAFQAKAIYAAFAVIGIILGAAYMLWMYQRMMFGTLDKPENETLTDCNPREVAYMVPLIIFMLWIGLYPKPYLRLMEPSVNHLVQQMQERTAQMEQASAPVFSRQETSDRTTPFVLAEKGGLSPAEATWQASREKQPAGGCGEGTSRRTRLESQGEWTTFRSAPKEVGRCR